MTWDGDQLNIIHSSSKCHINDSFDLNMMTLFMHLQFKYLKLGRVGEDIIIVLRSTFMACVKL
jgi:hypothetical protein